MRTVQTWTCELGYGADTMFHRTSTSPFVILYIMVSLLWSLRVCRGSYPRSDTIADTETGNLLRRKGMFFTNRAARRCVISCLVMKIFFYPREAMLAQYLLSSRVRLSVLSVRHNSVLYQNG